ncbi:MAG: hypothetical protein HOP11_11725 [Saprospiraceae bacterium]|nr:hypothetical protein [Saprospiraceae bacterium]
MLKITAVKYINTLPFIKAIQSSERLQNNVELITADPKDCALSLLHNKSDLVLLPVGAISDFSRLYCQLDYCIACYNDVGTVGIFSNQEWDSIKTIKLSPSSRSSNLLLNTLNTHFLDNQFELLDAQSNVQDASLIIGDEAFLAKSKFKNYFDLGNIWKQKTGQSFVFAIWVSQVPLPDEIIKELNTVFSNYTSHVALEKLANELDENNFNVLHYFHHQMRYNLDKELKDSLQFFLELNNFNSDLLYT